MKKNKKYVDRKYGLWYIHSHPLTTRSAGNKVLWTVKAVKGKKRRNVKQCQTQLPSYTTHDKKASGRGNFSKAFLINQDWSGRKWTDEESLVLRDFRIIMESLILAQNERWRRVLSMQVERQDTFGYPRAADWWVTRRCRTLVTGIACGNTG